MYVTSQDPLQGRDGQFTPQTNRNELQTKGINQQIGMNLKPNKEY